MVNSDTVRDVFLLFAASGTRLLQKKKAWKQPAKKRLKRNNNTAASSQKVEVVNKTALLHKQLLPSNTFETCSLTLLGSVLSRAAQISENAEHLPRLGCTLVG